MAEHHIEAQVAESCNYDKGFTAGTRHAHNLINQYIESIKHTRGVLEEDNHNVSDVQHQINCLEQAKSFIRLGYFADE
jgi:hypothetical protein